MTALGLLTRFGLSQPVGGPPGPEQTGITGWTTPGSATPASTRGGWSFQVGAQPITVTKLRAYKNGAGAQTLRVIIHSNSGPNTQVATADITTSTADAWAEASITPVVLPAGGSYTISMRENSGAGNVYRNATGLTYSNAFVVLAAGLIGSGNDVRPISGVPHVYSAVDLVFTV